MATSATTKANIFKILTVIIAATGCGGVVGDAAPDAGQASADDDPVDPGVPGSADGRIEPSNQLRDLFDLAGDADRLDLSTGAQIDTDTGRATRPDGTEIAVMSRLISAPVGGVPIRVYLAHSVVTGNVVVTGSAALAILSAGDVEIGGELQVRGGELASESSCAGSSGQVGIDAQPHGGAGGGSNASGGGRGGSGSTGQAGGLGGVGGGAAGLEPLRGGCPGGTTVGGGTGGHGGGALQITSGSSIQVLSSGRIQAGGDGGASGQATTGGGGGGGGSVLLEAPVVVIAPSGGISANGGGGGCRNGGGGADGSFSRLPAAGCNPGGGTGAAAEVNAAGASTGSGAGGGGGIGRIRINTLDGVPVLPASALLSPEPSIGVIRVRTPAPTTVPAVRSASE